MLHFTLPLTYSRSGYVSVTYSKDHFAPLLTVTVFVESDMATLLQVIKTLNLTPSSSRTRKGGLQRGGKQIDVADPLFRR